jgi:hypothetical protein
MSTEKQREANRANAQNSTGPTTDAGKAKCRLNGLSHGFAVRTVICLGETPQYFWALLRDFMADLKPANLLQQVLVEKIAQNHWTSSRISCQLAVMYGKIGEGPVLLSAFQLALPLLSRYQATADRNFHRCIAEFLKLQKQTPKSEIGSAPQNQPEAPETQPDPPAETPASPPPDPIRKPEFEFPLTGEQMIAAIDAEADELMRRYREKHTTTV